MLKFEKFETAVKSVFGDDNIAKLHIRRGYADLTNGDRAIKVSKTGSVQGILSQELSDNVYSVTYEANRGLGVFMEVFRAGEFLETAMVEKKLKITGSKFSRMSLVPVEKTVTRVEYMGKFELAEVVENADGSVNCTYLKV